MNWEAANAAAAWGALALGVLVLVWNRIDVANAKREQERADRELRELRDSDRADLQFGEMWGGMALEPYTKADMTNAVRIPLENHGRRDTSVSKAEWVLWDAQRGDLTLAKPMYLEPAEKWTGRGDLTIPAGTRRMFRFPLNRRAETILQSGQTLRLYLMPVGRNELTRADLDINGITTRPWTAAETAEGEAVERMLEEQADRIQG